MPESTLRVYNESEVQQIVANVSRAQRIAAVLELLQETYEKNPNAPEIILDTIREVRIDYGFLKPETSQDNEENTGEEKTLLKKKVR